MPSVPSAVASTSGLLAAGRIDATKATVRGYGVLRDSALWGGAHSMQFRGDLSERNRLHNFIGTGCTFERTVLRGRKIRTISCYISINSFTTNRQGIARGNPTKSYSTDLTVSRDLC